MANSYDLVQPIGADPNPESFFTTFLSLPIAIALYAGWKIKTRGGPGLYVRSREMDVLTGLRQFDPEIVDMEKKQKWGIRDLPVRLYHAVFI